MAKVIIYVPTILSTKGTSTLLWQYAIGQLKHKGSCHVLRF